jgi:hypothetical protein
LVIPTTAHASQTGGTQRSAGSAFQIGQVNVRNLPLAQISSPASARAIPNFVPASPTSGTGLAVNKGSVTFSSSGVSVDLTLNGVFGGTPNLCGCTPPDPNSGVGPRHVFMTANIAGIIYLKDGTIAKNTFSLADFFNVPVNSLIGDPEVMFDASSGRWFVSSIVAPNNVEFAVSTSDDPTGTFMLYSVSGGSIFPDQPFIGTNNDKFVISVNAFTTHAFAGALFWVFSKTQLVNGASTVDFVAVGPNPALFSAHPARHLTSTTTFYLVSVAFGSANSATLLAITGVPPGPISVASNSVAVSPISNPPKATQATTGTKLNTNDDRVLSAVWESNVLWFSLTDSCVPAGDAKIRSCARLVELTTSGTGAPAKVQDFDYAIANTYLFYPAVSLSNGKLVLVYGESSVSIFPSLVVTGRLPTDPANTLQSPVVLRAGTTDDESTRYGDYFGAATDPSGGSFWVTGEYRVDETFQNWSTAIAQVQIA